MAGRHVHESRHARLEHLPVPRSHRRRAHRLQRQAVIRLVARDDLYLRGPALRFPEETGRLERRLVRLRAARRQEDRLHGAVGQRHEALGELDGGNVRRSDESGAVRQLAHLRGGRVDELRASVTDGHIPQSRQRVQIPASVDVFDDGALAARVDDRVLMIGGVVERMNQVAAIGLDEIRCRALVFTRGAEGATPAPHTTIGVRSERSDVIATMMSQPRAAASG